MHVARAACAGVEVELEVGVAAGDGFDRLERDVGEWGAAQVRVQHDPRRVEYASERPSRGVGEPLGDRGGPPRVVGGNGGRDAGLRHGGPHGVHDERARCGLEERSHAGALQQRADARQGAACVAHGPRLGGVVGGGAPGAGATGAGCTALGVTLGGGGGFGVVNRRSLLVTRPLSARTDLTLSRYVVFGLSGWARTTLSVVNGPGRAGARFAPVVSAAWGRGSGWSGRRASESARRAESAA